MGVPRNVVRLSAAVSIVTTHAPSLNSLAEESKQLTKRRRFVAPGRGSLRDPQPPSRSASTARRHQRRLTRSPALAMLPNDLYVMAVRDFGSSNRNPHDFLFARGTQCHVFPLLSDSLVAFDRVGQSTGRPI
jgi:hypothetical protein